MKKKKKKVKPKNLKRRKSNMLDSRTLKHIIIYAVVSILLYIVLSLIWNAFISDAAEVANMLPKNPSGNTNENSELFPIWKIFLAISIAIPGIFLMFRKL